MKYEIIQSESIDGMEVLIDMKISMGYTLQGGISYANGKYIQAVVKQKKDW